MSDSKLKISKFNAINYSEFKKERDLFFCKNLFVITHLGQLKQMEALIRSKNLKNNNLIVLYTKRNLIVPQNVHNQYANLFTKIIFVKIPWGVNKLNIFDLIVVKNKYETLIKKTSPEYLYLNSFEGHYAILASIAKHKDIKLVLVEEGTATYKLNHKNTDNKEDYISFEYFLDHFMSTVGTTQLFKKLVKIKKNSKELYGQSKKLVKNIINDEKLNRRFIKLTRGNFLKSSLVPFVDFDKAYVSNPELIRSCFEAEEINYFLAYEDLDKSTIEHASRIIKKYNISSNDVIFISQRYHLDPKQYADIVEEIISPLCRSDQKIFIKLHPKENENTYEVFKNLSDRSLNKFILIEENRFLIEPIIKLAKVDKVIGITSTTLIYTSLISPNTKVLSIAESLLEKYVMNDNDFKSLDEIMEHLLILRIFGSIEFI